MKEEKKERDEMSISGMINETEPSQEGRMFNGNRIRNETNTTGIMRG